MKTAMNTLLRCLVCLSLLFAFATPALALNTLLSYTSFPPVVSEPTTPNVLVMISNDHTGFYMGYPETTKYDNTIDYWGYFDPNKYYSYKSGTFNPEGWAIDHYVPDGTTTFWSGNFLNWVTMCHADFLRKALTGGQRSVDATADGATTLMRGDIPLDNHRWEKQYTGSDLNKLVPGTYANPLYSFYNYGTVFDIRQGTVSKTRNKPLTVAVAVCLSAMPEDGCTQYPNGNWKPQGLLQRYHDKMRFGLMSYSHAYPDRGGVLRTKMSDISDEFSQVNGSENSSADSIIRYVNNYTQKGWDPLAEMLYDGIRYIRGNEAGQSGYCGAGTLQTDDSYAVYGCKSNKPWDDPVQTWCQKNNIIIINDEYPSQDGNEVPNNAFNAYSDSPAFAGANTPYNPDLKGIADKIGQNEGMANGSMWEFADYAGNTGAVSCTDKAFPGLGSVRGICPAEATSGGTFYLAALAYDAFTEDMRPDLEKAQNIRTYTIAFRASPGGYQIPPPPLNQMWLAGKYGNFDDKNGNALPDLPEEWMKSAADCDVVNNVNNVNCLPKGFFYASSGKDIESAITEVFESILRRAASGTAVSVLATSGQGEGNLVQAYYRPAIAEGTRDIKWTGYLQSLWVDKYGYIREDTNGNLKLDEDADYVVKYFLDADGTTRVRRYPVDSLNMFPDLLTDSFDVIEMGGVAVVWEGGKRLADTPSANRKIFTYLDKNKNELVDSGEITEFNQTNETSIRPYLSVQLTAADIGDEMGKTEEIRSKNLISFTRGNDPGLDPTAFYGTEAITVRDRVLGGQVWKLGDIIQSTPVSIAGPPDRFDVIYSDESYYDYYNKYKNRETIVYVGANDGMLHAFTSWSFDDTLQAFVRPASAPSSEKVGSELWAYIPQNLLPHLRWLAREDYTHVNYMDLQPRIFDARIFTDDADQSATSLHPGGWGTILVAGMNMGGGMTTVTGDFGSGVETRSFKPSYVCLDITDPRNPTLLWERSYDDLGFTRVPPSVVRVGTKKGEVFGSGWLDPATAGDWFLVFGSGPDAGDVSGTPRYKGESDIPSHVYVVDLKDGTPHPGSGGKDWLWELAEDNGFTAAPVTFDNHLNYNDDAVYFGVTYDADNNGLGAAPNTWQGAIYRVLTLVDGSVDEYHADPADWTPQKIYDSPRPITAPGVLSIDTFGNIWSYFGTGRYLSKGTDSDEVSTDQEYLFGLKDPFFDKLSTHYNRVSDIYSLTNADLLDATPFLILESGQVLWWSGASYVNPYNDANAWFWNDLVFYARTKQGWFRSLPVGVTAERSLNRPAVLGGLALYTTFSPKGDVCDYGGNSSLWALYYETGTAYKRPVFRDGYGLKTVTIGGSPQTAVSETFSLGSGTTSSVGVHVGRQNDRAENLSGDLATGFVQQGTGTVIDFDLETAFKIRSGLIYWQEQ